jgi:hypothetical protein
MQHLPDGVAGIPEPITHSANTGSGISRRSANAHDAIPLTFMVFDVLSRDGRSVIPNPPPSDGSSSAAE